MRSSRCCSQPTASACRAAAGQVRRPARQHERRCAHDLGTRTRSGPAFTAGPWQGGVSRYHLAPERPSQAVSRAGFSVRRPAGLPGTRRIAQNRGFDPRPRMRLAPVPASSAPSPAPPVPRSLGLRAPPLPCATLPTAWVSPSCAWILGRVHGVPLSSAGSRADPEDADQVAMRVVRAVAGGCPDTTPPLDGPLRPSLVRVSPCAGPLGCPAPAESPSKPTGMPQGVPPRNPATCPSKPFPSTTDAARSATPVPTWTSNRRPPRAVVAVLFPADCLCLPRGYRSSSPTGAAARASLRPHDLGTRTPSGLSFTADCPAAGRSASESAS